VTTLTAAPVHEFTIAISGSDLRLSPNGRSIAVVEDVNEEERLFHLGRAGGPLTAIRADQGWFGDDESFIVTTKNGSGVAVRRFNVAGPGSPVWEHRLDGVMTPALTLGAEGNMWRVVGWTPNNEIRRFEGSLDGGPVTHHQWTLPGETSTRWPRWAIPC
jgi:hypothetical protein